MSDSTIFKINLSDTKKAVVKFSFNSHTLITIYKNYETCLRTHWKKILLNCRIREIRPSLGRDMMAREPSLAVREAEAAGATMRADVYFMPRQLYTSVGFHDLTPWECNPMLRTIGRGL